MNQSNVQISPTESIQLSWENNWSNFAIRQNGQIIGEIPTKDDLKMGRNFKTASGKTITPILRGTSNLEIWCDGKDLVTGVASGTADDFLYAVRTLFVVGGILTLIGAATFFASQNFMTLPILAVGLIYIGLGWQANKTGDTMPFKIGMGLNVLTLVLGFVFFGVVPGILLLVALFYYL